MRDQLDREAQPFGIQVVDVRIRRADLPEQNSQAVYQRMQTERQREAAEFRAQGSQKSQEIRAKADRDVTVLLAEANVAVPNRFAARATANATASSPTPTARIRISSPSIARCRPMRQVCDPATPGWCCGRIPISSDISAIRPAVRRPRVPAPQESGSSEFGSSRGPGGGRGHQTAGPHDGFSGGARTGLRHRRPRSRRIPGRYSAGCGGYDANARPSLALDRRCHCGIWACDAMGGALVAFSKKITRLGPDGTAHDALRRARDRRSL